MPRIQEEFEVSADVFAEFVDAVTAPPEGFRRLFRLVIEQSVQQRRKERLLRLDGRHGDS
jgi:hypothetical protein